MKIVKKKNKSPKNIATSHPTVVHKLKKSRHNLVSHAVDRHDSKTKRASTSTKRTDLSKLSVDDFMNINHWEAESGSDNSLNTSQNGYSSFVDQEDEDVEESHDENSDMSNDEDEIESASEFNDDGDSDTHVDQESHDDVFDEESDVDHDDEGGEGDIDDTVEEPQEDKDYAGSGDEEEEDGGLSAADHKKSLQMLQNTDPEFYKFLEENDKKLLQFDVSDSDSEDEEKYHKPDEDLEVASEDSDYEAETEIKSEDGVITMKMIHEWQENIQTDKSLATIADVIQGFQAAMIRVTSSEESCKFKVAGSAAFNGIVQLCILQLQPALKRFLRMPSGSESKNIQPQKCKKWKKVKPQLKSYLLNLLKLLGGVSSSHIVSVLLKHFHQMTQFVLCFPAIAKKAAKYLITVWSSAEDTTRVISFLCILRIANTDHAMLETVLKQMYLSYVSNSKFTSPTTLAGINFMRRSLVEMYSLDESMSYQHVFLYIRQLAIHLRNAITLQKKEAVQAVLNWQYIHSLHLWSDLLAVNKPLLQPLLYPLVQIMLGTVKLIPTTQYYPLRFHLTQMMINISGRTNTFIPVMPLLLEVLTSHSLIKKHKKASMKPMDLTCILRVSKTEQTDISFKDAIVELVYQQMLQYLAQESHSISFPDLAISPMMQLRKFLKTCKVSNYCKMIKSLVDKAEENSRWIEKARKGVTLVLSDRKAVDAWETGMKLKTPPLASFHASFQSVNKRKLAKRVTNNDKLGEYDIPTIKKLSKNHARSDSDEKVVLFPSDDSADDESDNGTSSSPPPKKKLKKVHKAKPLHQKRISQYEDDVENDIVEDLKIEDF